MMVMFQLLTSWIKAQPSIPSIMMDVLNLQFGTEDIIDTIGKFSVNRHFYADDTPLQKNSCFDDFKFWNCASPPSRNDVPPGDFNSTQTRLRSSGLAPEPA